MHNKKITIFFSPITILAIGTTLLLLLSLRHTNHTEQKNPLYYHSKGLAAYERGDNSTYLHNLKKAIALAPDNPALLYQLARAFALNGERNAAIECLERSVAMGFYISLDELGDFDSIKDSEGFKAILWKNEKMKLPVNSSIVAFKVPEKDLMPEGIAYDLFENVFYMGSTYKCKVISIDKKGIIKDFITQKQDGLSATYNIKVDATRRTLWITCNPTFRIKKTRKIRFGSTGIFKYNLENGELIRKYLLAEGSNSHGFNDLCINSRGDVFITDSLFSAVYWISSERDELELFIRPNHFNYPNGITLSKDEKHLYVSHVEGISMINVNTKSSQILSHPENMALTSIDGLYSYEDSLVAIQRDNWHDRVIQFSLDESGKRVQEARILESGNPLFMHPTTGVIIDNKFYYIANSQMTSYTKDGRIFPMDKLHEIIVYRIQL